VRMWSCCLVRFVPERRDLMAWKCKSSAAVQNAQVNHGCSTREMRRSQHGTDAVGESAAMFDDQTMNRVVQKINVGAPDECWLWRASVNSRGYGKVYVSGKLVLAHRYMLASVTGRLPDASIKALHACDVRRCCNPRHLRWGTHAENVKDAVERGALNRGEKNSQSKLSSDDVRLIRSAGGKTRRELAKQFGVSLETIKDVKAGRSWSYVV